VADRWRLLAFVRDVIGHPRERVDSGDMRPHARRQEPRRDGKVLIVRLGQRFARGVGRGERSALGND
jgi:hypothetical protein